jgi:hypothetical protein
MNRGQRIVLVVFGLAVIWMYIQTQVFKPLCLNMLCPANDRFISLRVGVLFGATALALWALKSPKRSE